MLGIISVIVSLIPVCGWFLAPVGALASGVLGVVGIVQANKTDPPGPKGMAIAGLVLAVLAIVISIGWFVIIASTDPSTFNNF